MANGGVQPTPPPGQRHSGVVHGGITRRPDPSPRRDWLLGGLVAGLTVIVMLVVANAFGGRRTDVALVPNPSDAATPVSTLPVFVQDTPTPTPPPTPTWAPTATLAPTLTLPPTPGPTPIPTLLPTPIPPPTAQPTPAPTPAPTLASTLPPTVAPTPEPSQPATLAPSSPPVLGLVITQPTDGATTKDPSVVISGMAQPNATITHDVPLWFDEHTVADQTGRWSFTEPLSEGANKFLFRVGDDTATEETITVYYNPR